MRWMIVWLVLVALFPDKPAPAADRVCPEKGNCSGCHQTGPTGIHNTLTCIDCHNQSAGFLGDPSSLSDGAAGCLHCHPESKGFLQSPMVTRLTEKKVVRESFGDIDQHFFDKNCQDCHISGCLDCHGRDGHRISRPGEETCHSCHRGYFVGADYYGRAPREDALRYQRGLEVDGVRYLKMIPDIHAEAGLSCGACHTMASLAGAEPAKDCRRCHQPDLSVIEHSIDTHLTDMECSACHASWAPQEYGTFYIRVGSKKVRNYFPIKKTGAEEYIKSSYLKRQDAPPLGINNRDKISPIRPQFIFYYSDLRREQETGIENKLLAARWRAFSPHTIRRGTVMCDGCHENPSRFLLEPEEDRLYLLKEDGMDMTSFWRQDNQQMANGRFFSQKEYEKMSRKSPSYTIHYLKRWKKLIGNVVNSSKQ